MLEHYSMQTPKVNNVQYNMSLKVIQQARYQDTSPLTSAGIPSASAHAALGAKLEERPADDGSP